MSRFLSDTTINILEQYIQENQPSEILPAISECHREQAITDWNTINAQETLPTTYLHFANSAYGMTSYGFYKTRDGRIFLVNAFCGEITAYYKVLPNWNILIPYHRLPQLNFNISEHETITTSDATETGTGTEPNTPETIPNTPDTNPNTSI